MDKEKRNARQKRYQNTKDRINFVMDKGTKDKINQAAAAEGISAAEWLRRAIAEKLESGSDPPEEITREPFID